MIDARFQFLPPRFHQPDVKVIRERVFVGRPKEDGSDNAAHVPEPHPGPIVYLDCHFKAAGASEALKLPKKFWIAVIGGSSSEGLEDSGVDIVRGRYIWLVHHEFIRGIAERDLTVKGGASDVHCIDCPGLNKIRLGDYTKYDHHAIYPDGRRIDPGLMSFARPKTRQIHIKGGSPIVECFHSDAPIGAGRVVRPLRRGLDWTPTYFWARAKFFPETQPAPADEFRILPEEIAV